LNPGSPLRFGAWLCGRLLHLGLLKLRLGALPEADAAARVALRVLQEGDFAPGLGFAATVLPISLSRRVSLTRGKCSLACSLSRGGPRVSGRCSSRPPADVCDWLRGGPPTHLPTFRPAGALFGAEVWGMPIRETGYVHARSGTALALLRLGQRQHACQLADAELADVRVFGAPRALGIALRAAGLARGGQEGLALLRESVAALDDSPALLERARSMAELGAALRRDGQRAAAMARRIQAAVADQPAPPLDRDERLRSAAFHAARAHLVRVAGATGAGAHRWGTLSRPAGGLRPVAPSPDRRHPAPLRLLCPSIRRA